MIDDMELERMRRDAEILAEWRSEGTHPLSARPTLWPVGPDHFEPGKAINYGYVAAAARTVPESDVLRLIDALVAERTRGISS